MANIIDMNQVRKVWTQRYGENAARKMLSGASRLAYDAMPRFLSRRARDEDPPDASGGAPDDNGMEAIKTFLKNRLDPDSWNQLCEMMSALSGATVHSNADYTDPDAPDNTQPEGEDEPSPFPGRPRTGGQMDPMSARKNSYAQDARTRGERGYFASFPGNWNVTFGYGD